MNHLDDPYNNCKASFSSMKNCTKEDPKPELSMRTLQINLEHAYKRVLIAQQSYSAAYYEWLRLGEHISDRLKWERQERQSKL